MGDQGCSLLIISPAVTPMSGFPVDRFIPSIVAQLTLIFGRKQGSFNIVVAEALSRQILHQFLVVLVLGLAAFRFDDAPKCSPIVLALTSLLAEHFRDDFVGNIFFAKLELKLAARSG